MITSLHHFFAMGGYGFYVFGAYSCVISLLLVQGLRAWRKWHTYLKNQQSS